jgi:outer membrane protein assembly factor BamB
VNPSILRSGIVVAALDAKTGTPVWKYRGNKRGFFTRVSSGEIAVAGTYAGGTYYQSAPFTDQLIAFDAATGKVRWTFDTVAPVKMSPVIANGRLYVGDLVGLLYTLDARTGKALEVRGFHEPFTVSPPIIAGNKLIVANGTSVNVLPLSGVVGDLRYNDHTGADEAAHN